MVKVRSCFHPAVAMILLRLIPFSMAKLVDADLVEWGLKIFVSTPDSDMIVLIHRLRVSLEIAL